MLPAPPQERLPEAVTDPVAGVSFKPGPRTLRVLFCGQWYYFVSMESRLDFKRDPAKYKVVSVPAPRSPFVVVANLPPEASAPDESEVTP